MERNEKMICKQVLKKYGEDNQLMIFFEEVGELMQAISKHKRFGENIYGIAEEVADVEIMLEQIKIMFEIDEYVEVKRKRKIRKLKRKILSIRKIN